MRISDLGQINVNNRNGMPTHAYPQNIVIYLQPIINTPLFHFTK
jgi:hypothetical protein